MADGSTKPISDIDTDDKVDAGDPATGKHDGPHRVTATIVNHDSNLLDLQVETSPGHIATLHTTAEHPFWDETTHAWVPAADLIPGQKLSTASDGTVTVRAVHVLPSPAKDMFNLTVDHAHTYYVLADETPVLVHNAGGPSGCGLWTGTKKKSGVENAYGHWDKHKGDFPNLRNSKEYVDQAYDFMTSPNPAIQQRVRGNGDLVRFNANTNEFGVMTKDGVMRTYYKARPGRAWLPNQSGLL